MMDIRVVLRARPHLRLSLPLFLLVGVYAHVLTNGGKVLGDADTYWHIAVGRWIIQNHAVPHEGIFSATMPHAAWVAHEWLSEILLAGLFDIFGWSGLVVVTALCVGCALAVLLRLLLRDFEPVHALIAAVIAYLMLLPHILARPHIFTLPIIVVWVAELVRARNDDRTPSLWLGPLMTLWANLHGGWVFGLGLAALLAGEAALLAPDWPARRLTARRWATSGALLIIAALMTPFGLDGLLFPYRLSQMSFAVANLDEWRAADFSTLQLSEIWILFVLFAALTAGWRLPATRVLMVLFLLHMTLRHIRFAELLAFGAPLLVASSLAPQLRRRSVDSLDRLMAGASKPANIGGIVLAGALLLTIGTILLHRAALQPADITPAAALAAVRTAHVEGPVLNDYSFGGYLIFSGISPFIDGRAELYGDAFLKRYAEAITLQNDQLPVLLKEYNITWTLLEPRRPAVQALDNMTGWHRLYADDITVVHVRDER